MENELKLKGKSINFSTILELLLMEMFSSVILVLLLLTVLQNRLAEAHQVRKVEMLKKKKKLPKKTMMLYLN
jgi:hypothetical protein